MGDITHARLLCEKFVHVDKAQRAANALESALHWCENAGLAQQGCA